MDYLMYHQFHSYSKKYSSSTLDINSGNRYYSSVDGNCNWSDYNFHTLSSIKTVYILIIDKTYSQ